MKYFIQHSSAIINLTAAAFIFLFLYTGISKLADHDIFKAVLSKSPLLSPYAASLSWAIPLIEIFISVLLFFPVSREFGLLMVTSLMLIFTGYIAYMLITSSSLPCSCGGVLKEMTWTEHLIFNMIFLVLGITALLMAGYKKFIAINRISRKPV